jgi:hypothetical protein
MYKIFDVFFVNVCVCKISTGERQRVAFATCMFNFARTTNAGLTAFKYHTIVSHQYISHYSYLAYRRHTKYQEPIPGAVRSKAWACSHLTAGIAVSNPVEGTNVRLLCPLYVA